MASLRICWTYLGNLVTLIPSTYAIKRDVNPQNEKSQNLNDALLLRFSIFRKMCGLHGFLFFPQNIYVKDKVATFHKYNNDDHTTS